MSLAVSIIFAPRLGRGASDLRLLGDALSARDKYEPLKFEELAMGLLVVLASTSA
jgi:hypothetical protein